MFRTQVLNNFKLYLEILITKQTTNSKGVLVSGERLHALLNDVLVLSEVSLHQYELVEEQCPAHNGETQQRVLAHSFHVL